MQRYHLLTGATGLLGAYLLRDAALRETPMAVVVRRSKGGGSTRQRIEDLMLRWEDQVKRALPRPVVLEGNLHEPGLGLSPATVTWVAENCHAMIHNAASLVFVAKSPDGEPYVSNVAGTQHVLDLCRETGIRKFHHVSTAYVCGLREGRVLEAELDVGQEMANDYERSKIESEKRVRACEALDSVTVFRPGIIIGDSRTGYTSTYHGFYLPLKAASGLRQLIPEGMEVGQEVVLGTFGLRGHERKNLVPVDWVSAVMTHVINNPTHHGKTYHLTPNQATRVEEMAAAIRTVFDAQAGGKNTATRGAGLGLAAPDPEAFLRGVLEQTSVYQSYWRDDPEFDTTNTHRAAPHLPCPEINQTLLRRMATYAVRDNFGWPKPTPILPELDVEQRLIECLDEAGQSSAASQSTSGSASELGLCVTGPGGGEWRVAFSGRGPEHFDRGVSDRLTRAHLNIRSFAQLLAGELDLEQAMGLGSVVLEAGEAADPARGQEQLSTLLRYLRSRVQECPPPRPEPQVEADAASHEVDAAKKHRALA